MVGIEINKHLMRDKKVTTVMFVPKTPEGKMLDRIQMVENNMSEKMGWEAKVVEKPGVPLHMKFAKSFPMKLGCSRGQNCTMCDNKGTKCTPKRGVYKATCLRCKETSKEVMGYGIYIGESSRQVGDRVAEHLNKAAAFHKDSFIVRHWLQEHYLDTQMPRFRFQVVRTFKDALSRQLLEAVMIKQQGNLNMKQEFRSNELIRSQTSKYSWEEEKNNNKEKQLERKFISVIENFKNVILSVKNKEKLRLRECPNNSSTAFRFIKRKQPCDFSSNQEQELVPPQKKTKGMEAKTSTPLCYRNPPSNLLENSTSDIEDAGQTDVTDEHSSGHLGENTGLRTELERGIATVDITPPGEEPLVEIIASKTVAANEHLGACEEFRRRTSSLPAHSGGSYIKPSKLSQELNRSKSLEDFSNESEGVDLNKLNNWRINHSELESPQMGKKEIKRKSAVDKILGEENVSDEEVEILIEQKMKNFFYNLSEKAKKWDDSNFTQGNDNSINKRSISPSDRREPEGKRSRPDGGSPIMRQRSSSVLESPGARKTPRTRRTKSISVPKGQALITSIWRKKE